MFEKVTDSRSLCGNFELTMIYQDLLLPVIEDWSFFKRKPEKSIDRTVLKTLPELQADLATVIQGVRRCGKSTLLAQIMMKRKLPRDRCFFVNFEDPRLSDALDPNLLDAIVTFADSKAEGSEPRYFFLDEIQAVKDWEKWLRVKLDRAQQDCFIITGSNAALLSGELGTVLTGRYLPLELFPFNLSEYLKARPEGDLQTFLLEGGFPRALTLEDAPRLLRQYFTDIIERDVRRHVAARSSNLLAQVAKAVFDSAGSELSARNLIKRVDTSVDTMITYLDALTKAYMILPCPYFTFSEQKRLVRNTKWYPIDCALRASVITPAGSDLGKNFETVVFHSLRRTHREVYYWRGEREVDFVTLEGNRPRPIQVSWDGIKDRHKRAVQEFLEHHSNALKPLFITKDNLSKIV
jgi:predicted AAA+ superfamily ATPase